MLSTSLRLYAATFLEGQSLQKYELIFFIGPHDILSDHLPLSFEKIDNAKTFKYFLKPHNEYLLKGRLNTLKRSHLNIIIRSVKEDNVFLILRKESLQFLFERNLIFIKDFRNGLTNSLEDLDFESFYEKLKVINEDDLCEQDSLF